MQATPFTPLLDPVTREPRSRMFWVVLGMMVVAQLVALWLLCSQQVNKAQARNSELTVQQAALIDCLKSDRRSTFAGCRNRLTANSSTDSHDVQSMAVAVPVNFVTR